MPTKKTEEENNVETTAEATETTAAMSNESNADENQATAASGDETTASEPSIVANAIDTVTSAAGSVVNAVSSGISAIAGSNEETVGKAKVESHRAEKIGVVSSDKMTKTVVVRVDRVVKHPVYRKYIKRRKKFMAHDETGAAIGDKVRIIETRPLSAHKRWRVVEIIQKAEK